jgi:hypothetical protein
LVVTATACALFGGFLVPSASAGQGSADPSLLSRFFPSAGQVIVGTDDYSSYVYQWTYWQSDARIAALRDNSGDAYEHEAVIRAGDGFCWKEKSYDRESWDSDYPAAYLDTDFEDSGFPSRAGGSGKSNLLITGHYYFHWLRIEDRCEDGIPYSVKAQDSHRAGPCSQGYQWCVFADRGSPRDVVPLADDFRTGDDVYRWVYEKLYNDGFEDGTAGWHLQSADARYTAKWNVYASSGALERSRYLSFHCNGSAGCWIYQNAPYAVTPDDIWTGEMGLRCRPANLADTGCAVSLALSATGGVPDEHVARQFTVPADGKWHIYGWRGSQYTQHQRMRFLIGNDSYANKLDVDLVTLHRSDRF